jgi:hypothetical protein
MMMIINNSNNHVHQPLPMYYAMSLDWLYGLLLVHRLGNAMLASNYQFFINKCQS